MPTRGSREYANFSRGAFGEWNLVASERQLRVEVYMNRQGAPAKVLFDELAAARDRWDAAVGLPLSWERLDGRAVCRIAAYHPLDIDDETSRAEAKQWVVDTAEKMYVALDRELRSRAMALRASAVIDTPP